MRIISSKLIISRTIVLGLMAPIFILLSSFSPKPEEKLKTTLYDPIEQIVTEAIREKQFPGCQVLVLQKGQTIMNRSFGHLTYDSLIQVTNETIYDVASLTKVMATTLMVLDLVDRKYIDLDDPISCYLDEYVGSNKESITVRQLLAHNAGLKSYIPLWEKTFQSSFCQDVNGEGIFDMTDPLLQDSLQSWIKESKPAKFRGRSRYRYSDVGFMILHRVAEQVAAQTMEDYLSENFYQPLGLAHTYFNPLKKGISLSHIAPTELDFQFRYKQVWGEVHDRNALLLGGVSGHAGLFSNAEDIGKLTDLFLQSRDANLLSSEILAECLKPHFDRNRRGLGWDRKNSKVSEYVSERSFGHKGFTGTMVWADPEHDIVLVFLSNRIYPDAENWKLISKKTRSRIQDVVYEALTRTNPVSTSEVE